MRFTLVVGTAVPAHGAATVTRGRLGGSREAVDPDLELTLFFLGAQAHPEAAV